MRRYLIPLLFLASACVIPPARVPSRYVPPKELRIISAIQRGRELAMSNRLDAAEYEFRRVLREGGKLDSVYNNLGYVLQLQQRFDESEAMLREALRLAPDNLSARLNFATLLYARGELPEAMKEFQEVAERFLRLNPEEADQASKDGVDQKELVAVYRNIAAIAFTLGDIEKAVCYTRMTYQRSPGDLTAGQVTRLFLRLNSPRAAADFVTGVATERGNIAPFLLVDQAVAFYALKDFDKSNQTLSQAVSVEKIQTFERSQAALLNFMIALRQKKRAEAELLLDPLVAEHPDLCEGYFLTAVEYWPDIPYRDAERVLEKLCTNEKEQSFFSNLF